LLTLKAPANAMALQIEKEIKKLKTV